jgi:hypothetical protein
MLAVAKEWDSIRGGYMLICRERGLWLVASGQWLVVSGQYRSASCGCAARERGSERSREAALERSPRRKPWVGLKGRRAPTGRKNLPHTSAKHPATYFSPHARRRSSSRSSPQDFVSIAPSGLVGFCSLTHGLRRGLHSSAAPRLGSGSCCPGSQDQLHGGIHRRGAFDNSAGH